MSDFISGVMLFISFFFLMHSVVDLIFKTRLEKLVKLTVVVGVYILTTEIFERHVLPHYRLSPDPGNYQIFRPKIETVKKTLISIP